MKDENIYQTPESQLAGVIQKSPWSGKKLTLVTVLPSLFMIGAAIVISCNEDSAELYDSTKYYIVRAAIILAIICTIWTACYTAYSRKGNWLDYIAYSIIWGLGHALILTMSFTIAVMFTDFQV